MPVPCSFVPPYLLRRLVRTTVVGQASMVGQHILELDWVLRSRREGPLPAPAWPPTAGSEGPAAAATTPDLTPALRRVVSIVLPRSRSRGSGQ